MKKQVQLGLVAEGNSGSSAVLRLPKLTEELGPVKSGAFRVARRMSNMLRAGYAVAEYEELQAARLILLRVPDEGVPRIVDELCSSELVLKDLSFVLCESWLTADALEPLRVRGASVATLLGLPSVHPQWFVVEGQVTAVRQARRFLEQNDVMTAELRPGTKELYFAAEILASALPMPLLLAAQQALRGSGLSGHHLSAMLSEMVQKLARDFLKGARVSWGGPLAECSAGLAENYFTSLRETHPEIAKVIDEQLPWARERMKAKDPRVLSTEEAILAARGQFAQEEQSQGESLRDSS